MIASSREPLHVPGEKTCPILPLPVPERSASLEVLQATPSVQLFVERARSHKPAFELNEREAPAVAELVARLEGIPLALELAAARVRSLSVADINKRLDDRYKILTGGSRVLQERQQTLRALVDWSYELLGENEQTLLQRLAVFAGGFDLEAAEKVCGFEPIEDFEVLDLLGLLVEKSLVMHRGARKRFALPHAGDDPRLRAPEAGAGCRRGTHHRRAALRAFLQLGKDRPAGRGRARSGGLPAPHGDRTGQRAQRNGTGFVGRCGSGAVGQVRGGDAGLLGTAQLRHRGAPVGQGSAGSCRKSRHRMLAKAHALFVGAELADQPGRSPRGARHARDLPGAAPSLGDPVAIGCHAVGPVAGAPAGRRPGHGRGPTRARSARTVQAAGRPRGARRSACCAWGRSHSTRRITPGRASCFSRG